MAMANVNGAKIHYLQTGSGPDLVLLHGLGGNLAVWFLNMVPHLRNEYRITAVDLRGHGKSEVTSSGYTTADMAEDIKGLVGQIGIEKANILGHSWGADVALHFTILFPERTEKLVVVEPNIAALIEWRKSKDWKGWTFWANKLAECGIHVPPEKQHDAEYLLRQTVHVPIQYGPCKGQPRQNRELLCLLDNTTLMQDYAKVAGMTLDKIKSICRPTLALYGDKSHFLVTYEYLRDHVPCVQTQLIPDGDHYGPLNHPETVLAHVKTFLNGDGATC